MKCSCGAEIPDEARFCSKCGKMVSDGNHCKECGAALYPGARFCGKCRAPVILISTDPKPPAPDKTVAICRVCGAVLYPGAKYCGKCRTPITETPPKKAEPRRDAVGNAIDKLRDKTKPAHDWVGSKIIDKERAKKILIIALVIGLCFITAGFAGKISMDKVSSSLKNSDYFSGAGSELGPILSRSAGKAMTKLLVSLVKNDPTGFVNTIKQLMNVASSMAGDTYGMNGLGSMLIGPIAEEIFAEERNQLIKEAGVYWPLLQAMAYYHELLTIGFIIAIAAAVLWFLLDGKLKDIKDLKLELALYIGAGWVAIVVIIVILGFIAIKI